VQTIRAGDRAITPAEEWHWHGATAATTMSMISVQAPRPAITSSTGTNVRPGISHLSRQSARHPPLRTPAALNGSALEKATAERGKVVELQTKPDSDFDLAHRDRSRLLNYRPARLASGGLGARACCPILLATPKDLVPNKRPTIRA
jgi:hypothetical protein